MIFGKKKDAEDIITGALSALDETVKRLDEGILKATAAVGANITEVQAKEAEFTKLKTEKEAENTKLAALTTKAARAKERIARLLGDDEEVKLEK